MTKRQYLEDIRHIIQAFDDPEYDRHLEFLDKEIAALTPRPRDTTPRNPDVMTQEIENVMRNYGTPMTLAEIGIQTDLTDTQVLHRLNTLIKADKITKIIIKTKNHTNTFYKIKGE